MNQAPNEFVNFSCHHCNHCCTDVVCLPTPWDVRRIIMMTEEDPFDFLEFLEPDEIEGVDDDDPTWLHVGKKRYMMALNRGKKGCYFLNKKTKLCSIYAARPLLCRLYPFKVIENRNGKYRGFTLHDDVGCPKHQDGQVSTEPLYDLYVQDELNQEDYHELVDDFNAKKYPGKKPEDFVTLFTGGYTHFEEVMAED